MKNGLEKFDFYLSQLEKLFGEALKEGNVALRLYNNNARTTLFMLEGLAKIYGGLHDKKIFSKIEAHFKLLEDALGTVDYYDSFAREFSINKKIPAAVADYAKAQARENIQRLNDLLREEKWIGERANRTRKVRKKLGSVGWLKEKDEAKAIASFYKKQIKKIEAFDQAFNGEFTEIETQVHALRRKLRWLSIYPQALRGFIQLDESGEQTEDEKKYLTPEIINSPFNKLPDAGANKYLLMLDKNRFFALSWLIAELGKLKDDGLRVLLINEALQQTKNISRDEAEKQTYRLLGRNSSSLTEILSKASQICKEFFAEGNLDKLLKGIAKQRQLNGSSR
jgi:hypothetical protein